MPLAALRRLMQISRQAQPDIARHVIGYHLTQQTRIQKPDNALDEMASTDNALDEMASTDHALDDTASTDTSSDDTARGTSDWPYVTAYFAAKAAKRLRGVASAYNVATALAARVTAANVATTLGAASAAPTVGPGICCSPRHFLGRILNTHEG